MLEKLLAEIVELGTTQKFNGQVDYGANISVELLQKAQKIVETDEASEKIVEKFLEDSVHIHHKLLAICLACHLPTQNQQKARLSIRLLVTLIMRSPGLAAKMSSDSVEQLEDLLPFHMSEVLYILTATTNSAHSDIQKSPRIYHLTETILELTQRGKIEVSWILGFFSNFFQNDFGFLTKCHKNMSAQNFCELLDVIKMIVENESMKEERSAKVPEIHPSLLAAALSDDHGEELLNKLEDPLIIARKTNWRHDPRVKKLLEKETILHIFRSVFKQVYYGAHEMEEAERVERRLRFNVVKYKKRKCRNQKQKETETLIDDCLESLCNTTFTRGKEHTPESLLALTKIFMKIKDYRLASELIWCSVCLTIQEFIKDQQLKVTLFDDCYKRAFLMTISRDLYGSIFCFETCHSAFFTNKNTAVDVAEARDRATSLIEKMRKIKLSEEKKRQLENVDSDTFPDSTSEHEPDQVTKCDEVDPSLVAAALSDEHGEELLKKLEDPLIIARKTNWRHDSRVKKLLEKETILHIFRSVFKQVYYGAHEMEEAERVEKGLRFNVAKYKKRTCRNQKQKETETLIDDCLESLCNTTFTRGKEHTPESLLALTKIFMKIKDYRLANELIWCSVCLAIQEFIKDQQLKVTLSDDCSKRAFLMAISEDLYDRIFCFEICHRAFYTNENEVWSVANARNRATKFIEMIREIKLSEEKKRELEMEILSRETHF